MAITNLVQLTAQGMVFPSFADIRSAIIDAYKEAYGSDIDLSTGSADGVFVNNLALMMRNIIQGEQTMYTNLDVETAGGVYLDALCALSNVRRKDATRSNAYLTITNIGNANITIDSSTKFVSADNLTWSPRTSTTIAPAGTASIQVFCDEQGSNEAAPGTINNTVEVLPITISQPLAANVGLDVETDAELRARRNQSNSAAGVTVLQSLVGALLNISGIQDVSVYNNPDGISDTAADGSTILGHSIYVIIRKYLGIDVADEDIAQVIYNKLTPGVDTNASNGTNGTAKSYTIQGEMLGVQLTLANQDIYWKDASPITASMQIQITPNSYFTDPSNSDPDLSEYKQICPKIIDWFNAQPIGTNLTENDVAQALMSFDPLKFGKRTFTIGSVTVMASPSAAISSYTNPDSYYQYSSYAITSTPVPGTYYMTLS